VDRPISIAIETSCARGGIALGAADDLVHTLDFQADRRHAVQLVARLADLLRGRRLGPRDVEEVYVSIGPGSFTGLRVGVTVARTLAQAVASIRCVGVPSAAAVAENAADIDFQHLGVVMDAKYGSVYAALFARREGRIVPAGEPAIVPAEQFAADCPRPITLIGEGLGYHDLSGEGIAVAPEALWLPRAEGVWRAGRRLGRQGRFTEYHRLRPLYLRQPEAVRLWEQRRGEKT
jgi:tRNA threonylcarbamoyladenosine biosynthesis protein TsaB